MIEGAHKYQYDVSDLLLLELIECQEVRDKFLNNTHFKTEDGKLFQLRRGKLVEVNPIRIWGVSTKHNPEQTMALNDVLNDDITLLAITGHAGTGKTFLALLGSLYGKRNLTFTREIIQVGREMGFLPGEVDDKFRPYMRPFYDNIDVIKGKMDEGKFNKLMKRVSLTPLQFLRGGTERYTTIIVDEAQNCTVDTLKMAISRAGEGSKVILCGSMEQIDDRKLNKENNGLAKVIKAFSGQKCFSHVHLYQDERSELARLADILL